MVFFRNTDSPNKIEPNQISNTGYVYGGTGHLINDGTHTYQYDAEGRLISVDNGSTASYVYDALGQRVEKDVGGTYSEYVFNIQGQPVGINNRTNWHEDYIPMGQGRHVAHYAAGAHFMHPDALGTTGIVTSYTGAVEQDELHYPWGQEWTMMGSMKEERYARLQHRDSATSLDPTQYRLYSSGTGRWMTPDPSSEASASPLSPQSFNRYGYATGNPSNMVDPWGLDAIYCGIGVLCAETNGYIGINGPLSYTSDMGLTDLCIYSSYGCGYNGGYGSIYPYSNSGYTMPSYGGGSGYVPPSPPPPPAVSTGSPTWTQKYNQCVQNAGIALAAADNLGIWGLGSIAFTAASSAFTAGMQWVYKTTAVNINQTVAAQIPSDTEGVLASMGENAAFWEGTIGTIGRFSGYITAAATIASVGIRGYCAVQANY